MLTGSDWIWINGPMRVCPETQFLPVRVQRTFTQACSITGLDVPLLEAIKTCPHVTSCALIYIYIQ